MYETQPQYQLVHEPLPEPRRRPTWVWVLLVMAMGIVAGIVRKGER